jgi:hypothetical protein
MGRLIGYARVITPEQSLDLQLDELTAADCKKIFTSTISGVWTVYLTIFVIIMVSSSCSATTWYKQYGIEKDNLMTPEAMPVLIQALDDPDPNVRVSAIRVIAKNRMRSEALPKIKEMSDSDQDQRVRAYAKKAVRNIKPYSGLKPITIEIMEPAPISIKIVPKPNIFNGYKNDNITRRVGILPLELIILNNSSRPVNIMSKYIQLMDETGVVMALLPIDTVIKKSKYSLGVFMYKSIKANNRIDIFYRKNELKDETIHSGSEYKGLVFFSVNRLLSSLKGYYLEIPYKSGMHMQTIAVRLLD